MIVPQYIENKLVNIIVQTSFYSYLIKIHSFGPILIYNNNYYISQSLMK